jgi:hypothetical protein
MFVLSTKNCVRTKQEFVIYGSNITTSNSTTLQLYNICEISSSHGGDYDVQSCLLVYTAV